MMSPPWGRHREVTECSETMTALTTEPPNKRQQVRRDALDAQRDRL